MSEEKSHQHFLLETRSQRMHREEAIRRRRELIDKESRKPPVMRFGSVSSLQRSISKSVSPVPHFMTSPSKALFETSSPVPPGSSVPRRSRPQSRERSRRLPLPPGVKPAASGALRKSSIPLAKSYRSSPAVSRVASPVPVVCAKEDGLASRSLKRLRSKSKASSPRKYTRLSQLPADDAYVDLDSIPEDRKPPFMSIESPKAKVVSPSRQRVSRAPPPPPPRMEKCGDETPTKGVTSTLPVAASADALLSVSPFTLPSTVNAQHGEAGRAASITSVAAVTEDTDDGLISFRISEFRMPRTPQRRSSVNMLSCSPAPLHAADGRLEAGTGGVRNLCDLSTRLEGESAHPTTVTEPPNIPLPGEETTHATPLQIPNPPRVTEECMSTVDCTMNLDGNWDSVKDDTDTKALIMTTTSTTTTTTPATAVDTTAENNDGGGQPTPATVDVSVTVEHEVTAASAFSSRAYECSSTTNESVCGDLEEMEPCELTFDFHEENRPDNDEETNGNEEDVLQHVEAYERRAPSPTPDVDSGAQSQKFYECFTAPSTPVLQLPDTYRQLEATRREMATSTTYRRVSRRVEGRCRNGGRGSLVLVTGDLPLPHTPFLQEPHTPPPPSLSPPKQHSPTPPPPQLPVLFSEDVQSSRLKGGAAVAVYFDASPLPRPVTLLSQVCSPPSLPHGQTEACAPLLTRLRESRPTPYPKNPSMEDAVNLRARTSQDGKMVMVRGEERSTEKRSSSRVRSGSVSGRMSATECMMRCYSSEARERAFPVVDADVIPNIQPRKSGSGQISDVLSDASSVAHSVVAAGPRSHSENHTSLERSLRDAREINAHGEQQRMAETLIQTASTDRQVSECGADLQLPPLPLSSSSAAVEGEDDGVATETERDSTPRQQDVLLQRSSQSLRRRRISGAQGSFRRFMSKKNRERYLLLKRRPTRRHTRQH